MKKFLIPLAIVLLIAACNESYDGYIIEGSVEGENTEGTELTLRKYGENNQLITIDSAKVKEGSFVFKGSPVESPELHYIFFGRGQENIPVIVENGEIEIKAQRDSLSFAKIGGTLQNELFYDFLKGSRVLSRKASSMNQDMRVAQGNRDTVSMNALREEYFELMDEAKGYELDYVKENPNAVVSALIIYRILSTKAKPNTEVQELFDALTPEIKTSKAGLKIKETLENEANTSIGSKAPNFTAPTPAGDALALNDVLGKVTIVDFWAAWCKPCRAENPNIVRVYDKYKDKGLSILGVSLDRNADDWKKAIEVDGLNWHHVSNVQFFDEIARLYNVDAIPASFILDEKGVIVAKNLRGPALEQKIGELLQ
ncbi:TlpA disulfide reductase family protein [Muriicola soli]|uniref:AhpC/TSA family protein n=1 Tax=Muriicola soli TaxID=2507538 RepID=A0A411E8S0_9FLAO|nr:TlpA disulfide reductase family protein [Muriicola soli]QBA64111.1 AhpC/TSA family protein [Muriicola soli]